MSAVPQSCPQCGSDANPGASFCRKCGVPFNAISKAPFTDKQNRISNPFVSKGLDLLKTSVMMMLNPASIIRSQLESVSWVWSLGISGVAFTLLFLQSSLDMMRVKQAGAGSIIGLPVIGAIFGTVGVALVAALVWRISRPFGVTRSMAWTIRAFALGYSPTLLYCFCGLMANLLLGWNTAVAFGVTGVLWALRPMIAVLREMTGGKTGVSVVLATFCGALILFGWGLLVT